MPCAQLTSTISCILFAARIVVAGDGRYYNDEAITKISRVLAANGVRDIWIPQHG